MYSESFRLTKCRGNRAQDNRAILIESCLGRKWECLVRRNLYRAESERIIRMPNTPEMSFPSVAWKRTVTFCFPSTN